MLDVVARGGRVGGAAAGEEGDDEDIFRGGWVVLSEAGWRDEESSSTGCIVSGCCSTAVIFSPSPTTTTIFFALLILIPSSLFFLIFSSYSSAARLPRALSHPPNISTCRLLLLLFLFFNFIISSSPTASAICARVRFTIPAGSRRQCRLLSFGTLTRDGCGSEERGQSSGVGGRGLESDLAVKRSIFVCKGWAVAFTGKASGWLGKECVDLTGLV